jgi:hypothetical protein
MLASPWSRVGAAVAAVVVVAAVVFGVHELTSNSAAAGPGETVQAYVARNLWMSYNCKQQSPETPPKLQTYSASDAGLIDSAVCRYANGNIDVQLALYDTDQDSRQGWTYLSQPYQLAQPTGTQCNKDHPRSSGQWPHMKGVEGGWRSCDRPSGWIAWTVLHRATDSPELTHSILAVATTNGDASTLSDWWRKCKHQLGEGTKGMPNMPPCPGVKMSG